MPPSLEKDRRSWVWLLAAGAPLAGAAGPVRAAEAPPPTPLAAEAPAPLPQVDVRARRERDPLVLQQALDRPLRPSPDAAGLLGTLPGLNLARQAGAAGAVSLRGLGGSRLPIVADGVPLEGACNHGMDPATSYLDPTAFEELQVVKGPNSVRHGLALAGSVEWQTRPPEADAASSAGLEATFGSGSRREAHARALLNTPAAYLKLSGHHARADDYRDGDGNPVPSAYERHATRLEAGWRLLPRLSWTVDLAEGDGEAVYPAYHMDGTAFRRTSQGTRLLLREPWPWLSRVELRAQTYGVRHRMDDHSLREPPRSVTESFPLTLTQDSTLLMQQNLRGRFAALSAELAPTSADQIALGLDGRQDRYDGRNDYTSDTCVSLSLFGSTSTTCQHGAGSTPFYELAMRRSGQFAEWTRTLGRQTTLKAGWRHERWVTDTQGLYAYSTAAQPSARPGSFSTRSEHANSSFVRLDTGWDAGLRTHVALGHATRPADYVERAIFGAAEARAERQTELNVGAGWQGQGSTAGWHAEWSAFSSRIQDFLLTRQSDQSVAVTARREGGEASLGWRQPTGWSARLTAVWLHGRNASDQQALPQTPPAELRLSVAREGLNWKAEVNGRLVSRQDRVVPGYGNTQGLDIGPTTGFSVWSLALRWKLAPALSLGLGLDNLFDRRYVEHVNHTVDASVPGVALSSRVPEPGRTAWLQVIAGF